MKITIEKEELLKMVKQYAEEKYGMTVSAIKMNYSDEIEMDLTKKIDASYEVIKKINGEPKEN